MPRIVTIFITTPRSGTQWTTQTLSDAFGSDAVVTHEPIGYAYATRKFMRAYDRTHALRWIPEVADHLAKIHNIADDKAYVEVGFPAIAAIPLFYEEFKERLRLVQLVRHPVRVATSMMSHSWYADPPRADLGLMALQPGPGSFQNGYVQRWPEMTQFEKCVFYWSEVHHHGLEISERFTGIRILRTRFEDIIGEPEVHLRELAGYLDAPFSDDMVDAVKVCVDRHASPRPRSIDASLVQDHELAVSLMDHFGYRLGA